MKQPFVFLVILLSVGLLGIVIYLLASRPSTIIKQLPLVPKVDLKPLLANHLAAKPNKIAVVQNGNPVKTAEPYCQRFHYDYIQLPESSSLQSMWQYMFHLLQDTKYEYMLLLASPKDYLNPDSQKPLERLIDQSGDSNLIVCRSGKNPSQVDADKFLFRNGEWSQFKCLQLYNHPKNLQKLVIDQVYTSFKNHTLLDAKHMVDAGFPYTLQCTCVYNEKAFDLSNPSFTVYPWSTIPGFVEIPKQVPAQRAALGQQKIPRVIYQTMSTTLSNNDRYKFSVLAWQNLNPEYSYEYFDSRDCRLFIEKHFDEKVNEAYNMLLPGAFQADFWRYCVLYINGGCYVDSQTQPFLPLSSVIEPDTEFVSAIDGTDYALWQGFLCTSPGHPVLKMAIDESTNNILQRKYFNCTLKLTGPKLLGKCLNEFLGRPRKSSFRKNPAPPQYKLLCHSVSCQPYIKMGSANFLLTKYLHNKKQLSKQATNINHISGKENYAPAYSNRRVFTFKLLKNVQ